MGLRFKSACTHIHVRTAGPRILDRPVNSCYPSPVIELFSGAVDRLPRVRQRNLRKSSRKRLPACYSSPG
jgi:hypothetical protein